MDMDFDGVATDVVLPAVKAFLELGAREDPAGLFEKGFEQREFTPRQCDRFAVAGPDESRKDRLDQAVVVLNFAEELRRLLPVRR